MKNNQITLLVWVLFLLTGIAKAQENPPESPQTITPDEYTKPKTDWSKKFFTGGGLMLQFGTYTYVGVSPILGYRFTDKLSGGVGATYIYLKDRPNNFSTSVYGGKVFAEYDIYKGLAPHIEYEILNLEIFEYNAYNLSQRRRIYVNSLLVGLSYTQELSDNAGLYIMVLYNVLEDIYSPYENPILRIGFNVGF